MSTDELNPYAALPAGPSAPTVAPTIPELADRGTRLGARILDRIFLLGPFIGLVFVGALVDESTDGTAAGLTAILGMVWMFGFLTLQGYLLAVDGQSAAKRLLGIRIIGADGRPPGFSRAVIRREGARLVLGAIPYVGPMLGLVDALAIYTDDRRTLHDQIAGTWVVRASGTYGNPDNNV